jgi:hypothetical protein
VAEPSLAELLELEHRQLDELFGRFLGVVTAGDDRSAREAIAAFDDELVRHTAYEEERLLPVPGGHKLAPPDAEETDARLFRELRLEHVQVREVSAMIRRLLEEKSDLDGARRLCANLARRWDAHTAREERELFPKLP